MKIKNVLLGSAFGLLLLLFSCSEDENDAPVASDAFFIVPEDASIGTVIGTITATDQQGDALTYVITSGNEANVFEFGEEGALRTRAMMDFETTPSYELVVVISDGSNSTEISVRIDVTDVDEGTGNNGGEVTIEGITYNLVDGLIDDFGGDGTHYNYDFILVDDAILLDEDDDFIPGEETTIGIYVELFSAGDASFEAGTFDYLDESISPSFTQSYFNYLNISTFTEAIGTNEDPEADGYFVAVGGTVTVVENSELNYTLTYAIDVAEADFDTDELIAGGEEFSLAFSYTGVFKFIPLDETARRTAAQKSKRRFF